MKRASDLQIQHIIGKTAEKNLTPESNCLTTVSLNNNNNNRSELAVSKIFSEEENYYYYNYYKCIKNESFLTR